MTLQGQLRAGTPVMVQGATGHTARRHMALMRQHGTHIVAGVSPGRDGETVDGVTIYSTCAAAVAATGAAIAIQFVPARQVAEAAREALESGIKLLVTVAEGVPVHDSARIMRLARTLGVSWVGPSTPGIAVPGVLKLGFMPDISLGRGHVGVMSKSGTLAYEICYRLVRAGLGQSTWIGVGGDPVEDRALIGQIRQPAGALFLVHLDPGVDPFLFAQLLEANAQAREPFGVDDIAENHVALFVEVASLAVVE